MCNYPFVKLATTEIRKIGIEMLRTRTHTQCGIPTWVGTWLTIPQKFTVWKRPQCCGPSLLWVPKEGLEPSHLAAHAPETCASTNSATSVSSDVHQLRASEKIYWFEDFMTCWFEIYKSINLQINKSKNIKVPWTGLEPAHLSKYAPQTYVSTNFTTRAFHQFAFMKWKTFPSNPEISGCLPIHLLKNWLGKKLLAYEE